MATVSLPAASPGDTIEHGLSLLREHECSALIMRGDDGVAWLLRAGPLVQAASAGHRTLAEVRLRRRVHPSSHRGAGANDLVEADGSAAGGAGGRGSDSSPRRGTAAGTSRVQTPREELAQAFMQAPQACYCTYEPLGDDPHAYVPPLPKGGLCDIDGSRIVCS